jgi:hypothetical protein
MRQPIGHSWVGEVETNKIVKAAVPLAKSSLLQQADAYPVWAAIAYWPCAYLHENGVTGTPGTRHMVEIMPPAQTRAQYAFDVCGTGPSGTKKTIDAITGSDFAMGSVAAQINIPWAHSMDRAFLPHSINKSYRVVSGDWDQGVAATQADRILYLTAGAAPYVEEVSISNCVSFTLFASRLVADLETL